MKTYNLTKLVKGLALATALVTSVIACGNKNKDNQNLNAYQQSCSNCQNISGYPFFTTQTTAQSVRSYNVGMRINWSFSGQNQSQVQGQNQTQYNPYGSPAMNYSGQVSALGNIVVTTAIPPSMCPSIPAGQYNLSTQTVGTWNQGQISGLKFLVTGPVAFTAILLNAQATEYMNGYSTSSRIMGNLQIEQVNGYYCNSNDFYLY